MGNNFSEVQTAKEADELSLMLDASAKDILDDLGPITKEEVDYYINLK